MSIVLLESEDVAWFRDELGAARGAAAALARRIGLDEHRSGEVALAVSEVASNLDRHAVDGAILLRVVRTGRQAGVEFLAVDSGPGIPDVPAAMRDGMSSAGTLGIGLGAVSRLADVFDLHSLPGRGTVLAARFWPNGARPDGRTGATGTTPRETSVAGLTRAISGEQVCGDAWAARLDDGGSGTPTTSAEGAGSASAALPVRPDWAQLTASRPISAPGATATTRAPRRGGGPAALLMLCDGLGHGPMAALAAEAAVKAFHEGTGVLPAEVTEEIHRALRGTRGAALAVVRIEPDQDRLLFCGVGNIAAVLVGAERRTTLLSHPGIVGHQLPNLRTFEHPLPPGGALVMHSDGLTERWTLDALPGLLQHLPIVAAAQLLRHAGVRRDDAGVVVAKGMW